MSTALWLDSYDKHANYSAPGCPMFSCSSEQKQVSVENDCLSRFSGSTLASHLFISLPPMGLLRKYLQDIAGCCFKKLPQSAVAECGKDGRLYFAERSQLLQGFSSRRTDSNLKRAPVFCFRGSLTPHWPSAKRHGSNCKNSNWSFGLDRPSGTSDAPKLDLRERWKGHKKTNVRQKHK